MKSSLKAAIVLVLVCTALGNTGRRNLRPVKLTVFYQLTESSFNFFNNELYPTYLAVNAYSKSQSTKLSVELKPFISGKCSTEGDEQKKFLCANTKLHACASSPGILETDWHALNFIKCSMSSSYLPSNRLHQKAVNLACSTYACIDASRLAFCANSVDGDIILEANFEEFKKLNVTLTEKPVLLLNDKSVESVEDHDRGLDNLMWLFCKLSPSSFEGSCSMPRVASKKQFSFTDDGAFQLPRRCNYLEYANKIRE